MAIVTGEIFSKTSTAVIINWGTMKGAGKDTAIAPCIRYRNLEVTLSINDVMPCIVHMGATTSLTTTSPTIAISARQFFRSFISFNFMISCAPGIVESPDYNP
jgi:hypothetical protein